jgi:hypothetical protein
MKTVFKAVLLGLGSLTLLCIIVLVCYAIFGNGADKTEATKEPEETTTKDQEGINIRIEIAQHLESRWRKAFGYEPIVTLGGPDKTILTLESVRLNEGTITQFLMGYAGESKKLGFKKIIFIRQRYNEREFSGRIFDVETGYFLTGYE